MMNEGQFMALRAEAQEQNSLLKQILAEQKRTNELTEQLVGYDKLRQLDSEKRMKALARKLADERNAAKDVPVEEVSTPKTATKKGK